MKKFSLFLILTALNTLQAQATEYVCMPAAIDTYYGSVPVYSLSITQNLDDSDEPVEIRFANFYRVKDNVEKEVFTGEESERDEIAQKNSAIKFQSDEQSELYITEKLLSTNEGDVLLVSPPNTDPRKNKHRCRYQCSLRKENTSTIPSEPPIGP